MELGDGSLAVLGGVLLIGLLAPMLLHRLHLPIVSTILIVGAIVGPHGLDLVRPDATLTSFAFLGAAFNMLLVGVETHGFDLQLRDQRLLALLACNGLLPAVGTAGIALAFGYDPTQAAFVGAAFLSSSILVAFAMVEHHEIEGAPLGQAIHALAVSLDMIGAFAAFVLMKHVEPHTRFPLPILLGLVVVSIVVLRMYVPEVADAMFRRLENTGGRADERRVSFALSLLLLVLFGYAALDVPAFIGAFLVGFALAPIDSAPDLRDKLHLIGHALFIPVFLFAVGLETDLSVLAKLEIKNLMLMGMITAAIGLKLAGGYAAGRLSSLSRRDSAYLGIASTPRLSVSLISSYAGYQTGLLDAPLLTTVVVVSVATTVFAPIALELLVRRGGVAQP